MALLFQLPSFPLICEHSCDLFSHKWQTLHPTRWFKAPVAPPYMCHRVFPCGCVGLDMRALRLITVSLQLRGRLLCQLSGGKKPDVSLLLIGTQRVCCGYTALWSSRYQKQQKQLLEQDLTIKTSYIGISKKYFYVTLHNNFSLLFFAL